MTFHTLYGNQSKSALIGTQTREVRLWQQVLDSATFALLNNLRNYRAGLLGRLAVKCLVTFALGPNRSERIH